MVTSSIENSGVRVTQYKKKPLGLSSCVARNPQTEIELAMKYNMQSSGMEENAESRILACRKPLPVLRFRSSHGDLPWFSVTLSWAF